MAVPPHVKAYLEHLAKLSPPPKTPTADSVPIHLPASGVIYSVYSVQMTRDDKASPPPPPPTLPLPHRRFTLNKKAIDKSLPQDVE